MDLAILGGSETEEEGVPRDMNRFCQLLQKALKSRKLGKEKYNLFSKKNLKKNGSRSSEIGPFEIWGFVHVH